MGTLVWLLITWIWSPLKPRLLLFGLHLRNQKIVDNCKQSAEKYLCTSKWHSSIFMFRLHLDNLKIKPKSRCAGTSKFLGDHFLKKIRALTIAAQFMVKWLPSMDHDLNNFYKWKIRIVNNQIFVKSAKVGNTKLTYLKDTTFSFS